MISKRVARRLEQVHDQLLKMRLRQQAAAAQELAAARVELARLAEMAALAEDAARSSATAGDLAEWGRYLEWVADREKDGTAAASRCEVRWDETRDAAFSAYQDAQMWETAVGMVQSVLAESEVRAMIRAADDLAVSRYGRRTSGGGE